MKRMQTGNLFRRVRMLSFSVLLTLLVASLPVRAQTYGVVHNFAGAPTDGAFGIGELVQDTERNLYGTSGAGGANSDTVHPSGDGTVFKLSPTGSVTVLYSFAAGADGASPGAGLFRDPAGNLYGTAFEGGQFTGPCSVTGCGVVFKLDTNNILVVLHTFTGGSDGGVVHPFKLDTWGRV